MGWIGRGLIVVAACMVLASPAHAAPAFVPEGKAFGFNATLYPYDEPAGQISGRTLDAAVAAGSEYARMGILWRAYETETSVHRALPPSFDVPLGRPTGNWQTDSADQQYLAIVARGMTPVMVIHSAPYWASHLHTCLTNPIDKLNSTKCPPDWRTNANVLYPAKDRMAHFWTFVAAVTRRYPQAVIEGNNEPDYQHATQLRYHPPISLVAEAQCNLAGAVRQVDPNRTVLSSGLYLMQYAKEYFAGMGGRDCFDAFSTHIGGALEVRAGFGSGIQARLQEIRWMFNNYGVVNKRIWITETGLSDTFAWDQGRKQLGEALVATAFPRWITTLINERDVDALLIHTVRESAHGEMGVDKGYGNLKADYTIKPAGESTMPRWCWLVLQNASTWPGCEGWQLPVPAPTAPSFYLRPWLGWPDADSPEKVARVYFLEQGHPGPDVSIVWLRCNSLGLGCVPKRWNESGMAVVPADRGARYKVQVTLSNAQGSVTATTELGPVIL